MNTRTHTHQRHHAPAPAHTTNMCEGPLLGKLIRYAVPLWMTGLMQIAFHAADMAVIGRFGSDKSMAAIGAIGEMSWLLICVVIGSQLLEQAQSIVWVLCMLMRELTLLMLATGQSFHILFLQAQILMTKFQVQVTTHLHMMRTEIL